MLLLTLFLNINFALANDCKKIANLKWINNSRIIYSSYAGHLCLKEIFTNKEFCQKIEPGSAEEIIVLNANKYISSLDNKSFSLWSDNNEQFKRKIYSYPNKLGQIDSSLIDKNTLYLGHSNGFISLWKMPELNYLTSIHISQNPKREYKNVRKIIKNSGHIYAYTEESTIVVINPKNHRIQAVHYPKKKNSLGINDAIIHENSHILGMCTNQVEVNDLVTLNLNESNKKRSFKISPAKNSYIFKIEHKNSKLFLSSSDSIVYEAINSVNSSVKIINRYKSKNTHQRALPIAISPKQDMLGIGDCHIKVIKI